MDIAALYGRRLRVQLSSDSALPQEMAPLLGSRCWPRKQGAESALRPGALGQRARASPGGRFPMHYIHSCSSRSPLHPQRPG